MTASEEVDPDLQAGVAALAAEMRQHGQGRHDPVREVAAMLGDRWTTLLLLVLGTGSWRHAALRRTVGQLSAEGSISQRVLTLKLRALERNGFVARTTSGDVPPRVSYRLTPLGLGLAGQARRQIDWVIAHRGAIEAARQDFDGLLTARNC
jgi:DNA-binding HxlR family transcriptional regulator